MADLMFKRISPDPSDEALTKAAYERHNAEVRAEVPPERLIDWLPEDGWDRCARASGCRCPPRRSRTRTPPPSSAMTGLDPV